MDLDRSYGVVVAINDYDVLESNLKQSRIITCGMVAFAGMSGYVSAGAAYNDGMDEVRKDIVIFAHQDVYLPDSWFPRVEAAIEFLTEADPKWAVCGLVGITNNGTVAGRVWSSGLDKEIVGIARCPIAVTSVDEMVIILRRRSALRFDAALPGFHLYGTDIVMAALAKGMGAYVIDAPAVHNSLPVSTLSGDYTNAYHYVRRKWNACLPVETLVARVTRSGYPLYRARARRALSTLRKWNAKEVATSRRDPITIARSLGYEKLLLENPQQQMGPTVERSAGDA